MARTGPLTKDSTTVALGLAQIRIGASATNIGSDIPVLTSSDSIGALANTKFVGNNEFFKLESGFPMLEDATFPLRTSCAMEIAFKEQTPANLALANGQDPTSYTEAHTGEINLGSLTTPTILRMEAHYTYPDGSNVMVIIFPRCQVAGSIELDFAPEEPAAVAVSIEAKRADSDTTGGDAKWDNAPLGKMIWGTDSTFTTTTTTTTTTTA
jgi:hypothetical protein